MLTVRESLQLPIFERVDLVAGHQGIDNRIQWVHTVDIPDARYEWKREGVLVLTAGHGLQYSPERQAELIPKLVEQNFAGIVFCIGYYFDDIPDVIREKANEYNFPVLKSPADLLFIDITQNILEPIVNRQYALLQTSQKIYSQLTDLVLQGGNLTDLVNTLSQIINRSVLIEDTTFRVLAQTYLGPLDEMRRKSMLKNRTPPDASQKLLRAGVYARMKRDLKPVRMSPMPEIGMTRERLVVPIVVDRDIYGYLWVITDKETHEFDMIAVGHGATVAALIIFKENAVAKAEAARRGDFFDQLLDYDEGNRHLLQERARRLNFNLEKNHQVILVYGRPKGGGNARPLLGDVQEWFHREGRSPLIVWRNERVVVVLEGTRAQHTAQKMSTEMRHPARNLLIGVSNVAADFTELAGCYEQAQEVIHIQELLSIDEGVYYFKDLGLLHWLYHLPAEALSGNQFLQSLLELDAHDQRRNTELVKTLEGYLDNGCSLVETAVVLHIHRNTLVHRLKRIEELIDLDLHDPLQKLNMHVALRQYRLQLKSGGEERG